MRTVARNTNISLIQRTEGILLRRIQDASFSASDLAGELGVSGGHLNRLVQRVYGLSTSRLILLRRLQFAASLLHRSREMKVAQIAFASGFNHLSYFAKAFRDHFGTLPSNYKQNFFQHAQ
jgi:AraC-like DNA-binding protein